MSDQNQEASTFNEAAEGAFDTLDEALNETAPEQGEKETPEAPEVEADDNTETVEAAAEPEAEEPAADDDPEYEFFGSKYKKSVVAEMLNNGAYAAETAKKLYERIQELEAAKGSAKAAPEPEPEEEKDPLQLAQERIDALENRLKGTGSRDGGAEDPLHRHAGDFQARRLRQTPGEPSWQRGRHGPR